MTTVRSVRRQPTAIPGPVGHPLLGMAPAFRHDVLGTMLGGFRQHGDIVAYRLGPPAGPRWLHRDVVAVHHPDAVHQVFTRGDVFVRRTVAFQVLTEMFGSGLLTADGEVWRRQRRTLQPLFTPRRVAGYVDLMAAEAERLVGTSAVEPGSVVDLHQLMQRYTLHVVGRALFGDDVDEFVPALQRLVVLTGELVVQRVFQVVRAPLHWPTPRNRRMRRVREEQYAIVDSIIDGRRDDDGRDDLLSRLRAARDPQTGRPLSRQEIRDQVLVFLFAGHETTAGALTFTAHLLGRHPRIQDEVARGDDELVRATVQEGMRLFPPVHDTERLAGVDTELAGCPVPAGTLVFVSQWVTHRHPDFWPEPERFDPRRFVGRHDRPRYAYFPFGGGPRSCIGEQFALLEATVMLRTLLARYRIDALDAQVPLAPLITLRPARPVRATLDPRPGCQRRAGAGP